MKRFSIFMLMYFLLVCLGIWGIHQWRKNADSKIEVTAPFFRFDAEAYPPGLHLLPAEDLVLGEAMTMRMRLLNHSSKPIWIIGYGPHSIKTVEKVKRGDEWREIPDLSCWTGSGTMEVLPGTVLDFEANMHAWENPVRVGLPYDHEPYNHDPRMTLWSEPLEIEYPAESEEDFLFGREP
ncbi:MAG: hypothetical protein JJU29_11855 [Verrucomicrobia bacterium]|nr:hypothetical protein [Verrucomicrobiota bacterium]